MGDFYEFFLAGVWPSLVGELFVFFITITIKIAHPLSFSLSGLIMPRVSFPLQNLRHRVAMDSLAPTSAVPQHRMAHRTQLV
jgi:hypothetical protein